MSQNFNNHPFSAYISLVYSSLGALRSYYRSLGLDLAESNLFAGPVSGNSYPASSYSSPGMEYDDPLECDESEINCPACLLQVLKLQPPVSFIEITIYT